MTHTEKISNRLINEKSPYLLQHAYNPVNWYPWGAEAFEKAKSEDKPIFLSIGYSTCHWCHVMEREAFEDEEVAALMNDAFISIKVDREERPDIDSSYMAVCQMITGSGGWPLTIIMTAEKLPFFAATYIPKHNRFGSYGMMELIPRISELWTSERKELLENSQKIIAHLNENKQQSKGQELSEETLHQAYKQLADNFDETYAGFGNAPKFPTPHNLTFLLRYWKRTGEERALFMVERTLQAMHQGGIYDHIGFGFHRYSTDRTWLVPHFEKMLYDQAMLMMAYTETYQATGKEEYREAADEIFAYIARDMTSPEGGFFSAEDADSEGVEGKFYVWTEEEIRSILAPKEADTIIKIYNIAKANILHRTEPLSESASEINSARKKFFEVREKRIHPYKDDKILCDWNGLMLAALAKAGQVFEDKKFLELAKNASGFIYKSMFDEQGRLLHRYRDGEVAIDAFLDDYAFLTWGLLELYQATFESSFLNKAIGLQEITIKHFWDENNGGFFLSANDGEEVLIRNKEIYDGAIPSGNSVAVLNLLRLSRITGNVVYEEKAAEITQAFSGQVSQVPYGHTHFLSALDFALGVSYEVVIVGKRDSADTLEMLNALKNKFIPNMVLVVRPDESDSEGGKATAYVCSGFKCQAPTTEVQKLLEFLT